MKTAFRKSFVRDLKKIRDQDLRGRIQQVIEAVEAAPDLSALSALKKLAGTDDHYRIRIGDYRIGIVVDGDTVEFVRCLPRKDLYRYFP
jgi:mRNA interferase RelE/StbE